MKHARPDYDRIQDPAGLIPADEPVFLLRGQDIAAPNTLREWARFAQAWGAKDDIVKLALDQAIEMERYQTGKSKVPDLPLGTPEVGS